MYENPEMAFAEFASSRRLVEFLTAQGFVVEYPAYGIETAFAARAGKGGPEMVICAEYDALPGIGHACGHNIIATAALGAGVAVAGMADELRCSGSPSWGRLPKKPGAGKSTSSSAGAFAGAAAAMMVHPSSENTVDPVALAIKHLSVTYRGRTPTQPRRHGKGSMLSMPSFSST